MPSTETTSLSIRREFAVPPARVFAAWTDPRQLASWWWPDRMATTYEVDLCEGGHYRFATTGMPEGQNIAVHGEFVAFDADELLIYTWGWEPDPADTLVTVRFTPTDVGTLVELTHEGFATNEDRDNHAHGWNDCLDRLPELLGS